MVNVIYSKIRKCKEMYGREFRAGLVVRACAFTAEALVQSLAGELQSCRPHGVAKQK